MTQDPALPAFAVIGAQKAASTHLQHQLAQHPAVELHPREVRHFEDPYFADGAVERLAELFATPVGERVRGVKRPDWLGRPEIAERMAAALPDVRLLAVLRDPVSRAVSAAFHYMRHDFAPLLPVEELLGALLDGRVPAGHPRAAEILTFGEYGRHVQRFTSYFPREQLLLLTQELVARDPARAAARAFEHLGVDPDFVPAHGHDRSNPGVYSPVRLRLLRRRNHLLFDYAPDRGRREARTPGVLTRAAAAGLAGVDRLALSPFDRHGAPRLSPGLRARLAAYYRDDLRTVRELLGDDADGVAWLPPDRDRAAS